ncbi:hypothetical protein N1851_026874 [Merluccius polli]|uniref:Uncharacterized protein n=1 Tax=Merluccius polli TaxID=89951 RepID=A0AA47NSM8_MERPO|nr:hypothetical protein N1851_026874 [Merluccius polli]
MIPHKIGETTLKTYHVPERFQKLLHSMRFTCGNFTTDWQRLEVVIVTGCTIFVILFSAAMNLLVISAEKLRLGAVLASGIQQVPIRAFMDDLTITAKSSSSPNKDGVQTCKIQKPGTEEWACPGSVSLKIREDIIPTVQEKLVKSLGKWYRADLNDKESVKEMLIQAETWMTSLEKSGLPGMYKAWGYQRGVLPRLLVYEVPVSTVEVLERKMNTYLRRWLGVPRSFCSIGLYSTGSKLQLPVTSVVKEHARP